MGGGGGHQKLGEVGPCVCFSIGQNKDVIEDIFVVVLGSKAL